jgi:hypothetical protein
VSDEKRDQTPDMEWNGQEILRTPGKLKPNARIGEWHRVGDS